MQSRRGVEVPDDLNTAISLSFAITVMEFEPISSEGIEQVEIRIVCPWSLTFDSNVVIAGNKDHVAVFLHTGDEGEEFAGGSLIMNKIAKQYQSCWMIIAQQFARSRFNRLHSPKRH